MIAQAMTVFGGLVIAAVIPPGVDSIAVTPSQVTIENIRPGTSGVAEVVLTNTGGRAAKVSVTGQLTSEGIVDEEDLLHVDLAGCPQPWAGVPSPASAEPTATRVAPQCAGGEVPASSGSLPAVPLEAGDTLHLLITAGLGEQASNSSQGQSWRATFDVQAVTEAEPAAAPLAVTGSDITHLAQAASGLLVAGAAATYVTRKRKQKGARS